MASLPPIDDDTTPLPTEQAPPMLPPPPAGIRPEQVGGWRRRSKDVDRGEPGQLTQGWRAVLTLSWIGAIVGVFAVHETASFIGKPTWWQLHGVTYLPFVVPLIAGAVAYANSRWSRFVSFAGVAAIGVSALVNRSEAPGSAIVEAGLAGAMLLVTLACYAGRLRAPEPSSDDAARETAR